VYEFSPTIVVPLPLLSTVVRFFNNYCPTITVPIILYHDRVSLSDPVFGSCSRRACERVFVYVYSCVLYSCISVRARPACVPCVVWHCVCPWPCFRSSVQRVRIIRVGFFIRRRAPLLRPFVDEIHNNNDDIIMSFLPYRSSRVRRRRLNISE